MTVNDNRNTACYNDILYDQSLLADTGSTQSAGRSPEKQEIGLSAVINVYNGSLGNNFIV